MPTKRLAEVRIADNNGKYEIHMFPGDGIIDFPDTFQRIEATGFTGHYMSAYGTMDDMLRGRDYLVEHCVLWAVDDTHEHKGEKS